jgi:hypothetical protein
VSVADETSACVEQWRNGSDRINGKTRIFGKTCGLSVCNVGVTILTFGI